MSEHPTTRRRFLVQSCGVAAGAFLCEQTLRAADAPTSRPASRVVIARDEALTKGRMAEHGEQLQKLLNASMQKLTHAPDAAAAWRKLFRPEQRIGIKVNTLGHYTQPVVVDAIVAGLRSADVPAENIIIWDRFDSELSRAGYKLNKSRSGVRCCGTDAERYGSGYLPDVETSGQIGSCFSRILAEQVDTLICAPVLKDHSLAGTSLGLKNFFGAIHNPNKYHGSNCDPYIVDVVMHRHIRPKWKLTICDATRAQYQGGPMPQPQYAWPFGGLLLSTDIVAVDAVGTDMIEQQRKAKGLKPLAETGRPTTYLATAAARGLGVADLARIERVEA